MEVPEGGVRVFLMIIDTNVRVEIVNVAFGLVDHFVLLGVRSYVMERIVKFLLGCFSIYTIYMEYLHICMEYIAYMYAIGGT